jgi:hypothetical protein
MEPIVYGRFWRNNASKPCATSSRRTVWDIGNAIPNRIDLGLGRAPGTDPYTAAALKEMNMQQWNFRVILRNYKCIF